MKRQDVLLKAMAKKITWWSAAEIIGVSDRTMRRWHSRLEQDGYSGLADRPNSRRVAGDLSAAQQAFLSPIAQRGYQILTPTGAQGPRQNTWHNRAALLGL